MALTLLAWSGWKLVDRRGRPDLDIGPAVVGAAVLAAAAVALALVAARPTALDRLQAAFWPPALAAVVVGVGTCAALVGPRERVAPSALEVAVGQAAVVARQVRGGPVDTIALFGTDDVRSVLGGDFRLEPEQVTDRKHHPGDNAAVFDAALEDVESPLLVVGDGAGVPKGYAPPDDWCPVTRTPHEVVYLHDGGAACPA